MEHSSKRDKVTKSFIDEIFGRMRAKKQLLPRYIQMLETVIRISEKKGVNVKPHATLRDGVPITSIKVKF